MSKVYATINGFVGHGGQSVPIQEGDEYDADHELVQAHPQHFTARPSPAAAVADAKAAKARNARS